MILELHQQGLSISAIAERSGKDRKTVRKYIRDGLKAPAYKVRAPAAKLLGRYEHVIEERIKQWPQLSCARLLREVRELGYQGGITILKDFVADIRPPAPSAFEVRFETPAGQQAQVDFAHFLTEFSDAPGETRKVWLFSMVLGHSRYIWARYALHQDLGTVLRCHAEAFEHFLGVPGEILYDRMKTAVLGDRYDGKHIVYNAKLLGCAQHYGFTPRACQAYRAKTKGKVERPFRYIRADFFMGRSFANLDDLNAQLRVWLDTVANVRQHGTTNRIVIEHFLEERASLIGLPAGRFDTVLKLERRLTNDGCVSVGGNLYSVPDGTPRRPLDVELTAHEVRISDAGQVVATHTVLLGRNERSVLAGHRSKRLPLRSEVTSESRPIGAPGHSVARRDLAVYEAIAARLGQLKGAEQSHSAEVIV